MDLSYSYIPLLVTSTILLVLKDDCDRKIKFYACQYRLLSGLPESLKSILYKPGRDAPPNIITMTTVFFADSKNTWDLGFTNFPSWYNICSHHISTRYDTGQGCWCQRLKRQNPVKNPSVCRSIPDHEGRRSFPSVTGCLPRKVPYQALAVPDKVKFSPYGVKGYHRAEWARCTVDGCPYVELAL